MAASVRGEGGGEPGRRVYEGARQGLLTRVADPLSAWSRRRRHELFRRLMEPGEGERVLDIGCGPPGSGLSAFEHELPITGVDAVNRPGYERGSRSFVCADARALPFEDGSFAIAYSNSVIEHLAPADRPRFADEVRRVAGRYFVQTPNRWFPVEPHVLLPFFQFLPEPQRRRLWGLGVSRDEFSDIRLLDAAELRELFPDAVIVREHFGGLTKSLIAAGPVDRIRTTRAREAEQAA